MRVLLISPKNRTIYNFKGDLIKELLAKGHEVWVTGPDETDLDRILALGVQFILTPMTKTGTSVFGDFRYFLSLRKIFKQHQIDVVLSYTVKPIVYGSMAAKLAKVKHINSMVTGAGYVFTATTPKAKALSVMVKCLYKVGFKCSDRVIFLNKDDQEEFCKGRLLQLDKCYVIDGEGVNMTQFAKTLPYPKPVTFFMLSRLLRTKGVMEYLQAAKNVKARYPQVQFMLLGSYHAMPQAIPLSEIEPYEADGTVTRYEEHPNVKEFYEKCSVYVLPSYREGVPRTVLEAMAMERPIITTDANGCRETVIHGYNGFLIPVQDIKALEEKMEYFILHEDKIEEMGKNAFDLCKKKFEVPKINKDILEILWGNQ